MPFVTTHGKLDLDHSCMGSHSSVAHLCQVFQEVPKNDMNFNPDTNSFCRNINIILQTRNAVVVYMPGTKLEKNICACNVETKNFSWLGWYE